MKTVSTQALNGARRAVGTHHGPTWIHGPTTAYAIGGTATLALRYPIISASGMTAGRRELLGDHDGQLPLPPGPQDLQRDCGPDGAVGGLKPEYTAASGLRDYGSGPTTGTRSRLRPTRHGPGGTLLDLIAVLFISGQLEELGTNV